MHLEPDTGYNLPISAPPNDVSTPFLLGVLAEQQAVAALLHSEDEMCPVSIRRTKRLFHGFWFVRRRLGFRDLCVR